ncbi:MAG: peptide-methionine (S)-S-oxide reductase MsrA [Fimbriimonadaceae bacterium]|nr:peptide-methionine (S)-S-oxide reductase MsrA [Fimbriimonadaceae bacterium]
METPAHTELATFAAGCFWGVELEFGAIDGVLATRVGYTGGVLDDPSYEDICDGDTGHAEAVEVTFDPTVVSYDHLVREFMDLHDPTTLNRQGPDVGDQYRSAIFTHSDEQVVTANRIIEELGAKGEYDTPIVTEVVPSRRFWEAEEYHQKYLANRGIASCHIRRK